jgi:hypothetical protein
MLKLEKTHLFNLILHQVMQHFFMNFFFVKRTLFKDTNAFTIHSSQTTKVNNFSFWKCQSSKFRCCTFSFLKGSFALFFNILRFLTYLVFFFCRLFSQTSFQWTIHCLSKLFGMIKCFASTYFFNFIISLFLKMISTFPWLHYRTKMSN